MAFITVLLGISWLGVRDARAEIADIRAFLEMCPTNDPAYAQIRSDFTILRDGVAVGALACTGPISSLPIAQYSDELILVQGLRALYYMDRGRTNHLPWTTGTIYSWMKTRIRGFNLSSTAGFSTCCVQIGGEFFADIKAQDASNRHDDRTWPGISGNIALYAHEVRHRDGFSHDSGCGLPNGCDPEYNEANFSSYAIQWWLNANWLSGYLHVGFACGDPATTSMIANWHLSGANSIRSRFSRTPPRVLSLPAQPGGGCRPASAPNTPSKLRIVP